MISYLEPKRRKKIICFLYRTSTRHFPMICDPMEGSQSLAGMNGLDFWNYISLNQQILWVVVVRIGKLGFSMTTFDLLAITFPQVCHTCTVITTNCFLVCFVFPHVSYTTVTFWHNDLAPIFILCALTYLS